MSCTWTSMATLQRRLYLHQPSHAFCVSRASTLLTSIARSPGLVGWISETVPKPAITRPGEFLGSINCFCDSFVRKCYLGLVCVCVNRGVCPLESNFCFWWSKESNFPAPLMEDRNLNYVTRKINLFIYFSFFYEKNLLYQAIEC